MKQVLRRSCLTVFLSAWCPASVLLAYEISRDGKPAIENSSLEHLEKISKGISSIASYARKGIVFVSVSKTVKGLPFGQINPFEFFFGPGQRFQDPRQVPEQQQKGLGSGFIVDLDKGYVLTNNHVIDGADEIHLKLANGQSYDAKVVGRDKNTDVAVVQINDSKFKKNGLVALSLMKNSDEIEVGNLCVALGAPFGLEASISLGVVSALGRGNLSITDLGNFIQTDAAINPGNSGGPLLNVQGQVMGINTAIYSKSGGYNGIGFSIPSNLVAEVANQLINEGKVLRGYLGVVLAPIDPELGEELGVPSGAAGALIRTVEPGSPASRAGIEAGDVITEVEGQEVQDVQSLQNVIGLKKPGASVQVKLYRDGKARNVSVKLGNYAESTFASTEGVEKDSEDSLEFGLKLAAVSKELRNKYKFNSLGGAVVVFVAENLSADRAGLKPGDVIVKVNKENIKSPKDFWKISKGKDRVLVRIERQGQGLFVPLRR